MAYTPTTWTTGDTITATKLNKLENGVANAGSALIVNVGSNYAMDKTFGEIYEALAEGIACYMRYVPIVPSDLDSEYMYSAEFTPILKAYKYDTAYLVIVSSPIQAYIQSTPDVGRPAVRVFEASSANSYPTFSTRIQVNDSALSLSGSWE